MDKWLVSKVLKLPTGNPKTTDSNANPYCQEHKCSTMKKILKGRMLVILIMVKRSCVNLQRQAFRFKGLGCSCRGSHSRYDAEFTHKTPILEHSDISQVVNGLCLPQNIFQMVSHKFIILSYREFGMYLGLSSQTTKVLG